MQRIIPLDSNGDDRTREKKIVHALNTHEHSHWLYTRMQRIMPLGPNGDEYAISSVAMIEQPARQPQTLLGRNVLLFCDAPIAAARVINDQEGFSRG